MKSPPPRDIRRAAESLRTGAVAIFPTETVYGLGTSAFAARGIRRIYELKGRHWRKPLALLVPSLDAARPLIEELPIEAQRLAKVFCPGPMTFVFKASHLGRIVSGGLTTIGVRVPDHPLALRLLRAAGVPIAATSVNRSGDKPAASGRRAAQVFGKKVEWFFDGGVCRVKEPSSVVDFSHYPFTLLREGAIPKKELEKYLR